MNEIYASVCLSVYLFVRLFVVLFNGTVSTSDCMASRSWVIMDSKLGIMLQIVLSLTDGTATHLPGGAEDSHYKSHNI